jgi:hypothetical protein
MSNPIDNNEFKHYLRFNSLNQTALYEICEPVGFDGASFVKEQIENRYARTIEYGAIDTIEFPDAFGKKLDAPRIVNQYGDTFGYMDYGYQWIKNIYDAFGFESDIDYIIALRGSEFAVGKLDFTTEGITDGYSYFKFRLIQQNNVMDFQRQIDTKFNAFADKDINGNTIAPISTFNYLRRNTPVIRQSLFKQPKSIVQLAGASNHVNYSQVSQEFGIDNTLGWLDPDVGGTTFAVNNIRLLKAKNDLVNVSINVDLYCAIDYRVTNPDSQSRMWMSLYYVVYSGTFDSSQGTINNNNTSNGQATGLINQVFFQSASGGSNYIQTLPNNIDFTIPNIPRGHYLSVFWALSWDTTNLQNPNRGRFVFTKCDFKITATQVGIDAVIKATRYIDLIKQSVKAIKNVPVDATNFDVGGEHYNQAVFNRRMVSQRTDHFYSTFKNVMESTMEVNQDFEISTEGIKLRNFAEFYQNNEIGSFLVLPDKESTESFNPRFMVNNFKFDYTKFANDRLIQGTIQGIHTESEWIVPNKNVENKKEVNCNFVRDGFFIQDIINQEIAEPTTATENDDDVMVEDFIALAPNSFGSFGAFLMMRLVNNTLEILNRDSEGETNDVVFSWTTLGLAIGQSFQITSGVNVGNYTIDDLTASVITLTPVGFTPTFTGDAFIQVKYFYSNVPFQTRTDQNFASTDNRFLPNVRYSIKRNIFNYWSKYIKTMMLFAPTIFKNAYFKNNGAFKSQENGKPLFIENADVNYIDLADPILDAKMIQLSVVAEFDEIKDLLQTYQNTKGFVRVYDNTGNVVLGYIQKLDYLFKSKELSLTLELKYNPQYLTLVYENGVLTVNGVAYNVNAENWWIFKNDWVQFYDHKNTPITKFYKYNFVSLNGIFYNSATTLQNALLTT